MELPKYSVLMSVYSKEKPEYLKMAMDSMWNQTVPPDDFVLICDGPLTEKLDEVINDMIKLHSDVLNVVRLDTNQGLGKALNIGIQHCKNELIARMDSDDISRPDRCEKQLVVFNSIPFLSICSGTVEEFSGNPENVTSRRILPAKNWQIIVYAKTRNPFNHPCVMYRKSAVKASGGYKDFYLLEDYYLWVRMIMNDCLGQNLLEPLLWMRTGSDLYLRRGGASYALSQIKLFKYMNDVRFIKATEFVYSVFFRTIGSLLPNRIRKMLYVVIRKQ